MVFNTYLYTYPLRILNLDMATPTGNQGWAQLRQQARSLESQVTKTAILQLGGAKR